MNMLQRAREALTSPAPIPNPRFFIVSENMKEPEKRDPLTDAQITHAFAKAAKENAAMTPPPETFVASYVDSSSKHRELLIVERDQLDQEQVDADNEHKSQIERLNDEIRTRTEAHKELTEGNNARRGDINRVISAIDVALDALNPTPAAKAPKLKAVPPASADA